MFDVEKCFDSLNLHECINDIYESGIKDNRLSLIYLSNKNNDVSITTPVGQTESINIGKVVTQGSSWGSQLCSAHLSDIGTESINRPEFLYKYKNLVDIPCLEMCDDILSIAECGPKSVAMNAFINAKIEMKRLKLNQKKCFQVHSIRNKIACPNLNAHEEIIVHTNQNKYIGDIISFDGSNSKNIAK